MENKCNLCEEPAFKSLAADFESLKNDLILSKLFQADPKRFENFRYVFKLIFYYSKFVSSFFIV